VSTWLRGRLYLDRVIGLVLLAVVSPLIGALGLFVRRHDGGPALITVLRAGRGGQPFAMWKLRTMRAEDPCGRATGVALTSEDDPRVTAVGAKLRAYHLDELPQLYNVVRGEMCLLGPRPEAPEFVDAAAPNWKAVLDVPPGLAGPTQLLVGDWERHIISSDVTGRAYLSEVVPVKVAIDHWYVRCASPRLDGQVLVALLQHLLPLRPSRKLLARACHEVPEFRQRGVDR